MATLFSGQIGFWYQPTQRVNGTITGTVTRVNETSVTLTGLSLGLSSPTAYQGTKTMHFILGGVTNVLNVTGGSTYLGTFQLQDVDITVQDIQNRAFVVIRCDGYSTTFTVNFPSYPAKPVVKLVSKTPNSITVQYGTDSFGDGATGGTVTLKSGDSTLDTYSEAASHKTFTYSGLDPETTYTFSVSATNSYNNTSDGTDLEVTTPKAVAMYGSVNNFAKNIDKIYGSLNGQTKEIAKIYGSLDGVTKRIF